MPLPPPKSRGKRRKKISKKPSSKSFGKDGQPEETDSDEIEDEDEDEAIDRAIQKKYPDFQKCVQLIEELKKNFPQTGINGEANIWIIKPA